MDKDQIRTYWRPECYLCGNVGRELYRGLRDRLYGVPGAWNLYHCQNDECGLIWLNPMPLEEDIGIAYKKYFTHEGSGRGWTVSSLSYELLRRSVAYVTGLRREKQVVEARYLNEQAPGKLLEIGCGAGDYLARMRSHGWDVEGVEIDPAACRYAQRKHQLKVHECTLDRKNFGEDTFDAVVLNHVVEHVFDPVSLLKECRRIMKKGGRTIVLTPNAEGHGHSVFGKDWIGLDPPRHIFIFSPKTLEITANLAGFTKATIATTAANAEFFFRATLNTQRYGTHYIEGGSTDSRSGDLLWNSMRNARALLSQVLEFQKLKGNPKLGEEIAMICGK